MQTLSTLGLLLFVAGFTEVWCNNMKSGNHNFTSPEPEPVKLLYGDSHGISWTDLSLNERPTPILTRMYLDVFSVDYHYGRSLIFFTGWGAIWRLPMDEAGDEAQGEQVVGEDARAATMAVDWERDRLYWTSPASHSVWRADTGGNKREAIIRNTGNLTMHNNVVVDPYMRFLFLATNSGYILRSDLDGENLANLDNGLRHISLALDIQARRLYVCGNQDFVPVLQSSNYNGRDVIDYKINHGDDWWVKLAGIDVFPASQPPQMFWVHHGWHERDTVWRVNVSDGQLSWQKEYTSRGTILDPETRIWSVKVCHPDVQSRPKYLEWEEFLSQGKASRDITADGTTTAVSSNASFSKHYILLQTFTYLLITVILQLK